MKVVPDIATEDALPDLYYTKREIQAIKRGNCLLIGCPESVDLATLARAKKLNKLDHYKLSGFALYLFLRNPIAARAVNTFISQAICSWELMRFSGIAWGSVLHSRCKNGKRLATC